MKKTANGVDSNPYLEGYQSALHPKRSPCPYSDRRNIRDWEKGHSDGLAHAGSTPITVVPSDSPDNMELVRLWISDATPDELRTLRAIINGKLSRRTITKEQQDKMQLARRKP